MLEMEANILRSGQWLWSLGFFECVLEPTYNLKLYKYVLLHNQNIFSWFFVFALSHLSNLAVEL